VQPGDARVTEPDIDRITAPDRSDVLAQRDKHAGVFDADEGALHGNPILLPV
jgi:hypothetical protein